MGWQDDAVVSQAAPQGGQPAWAADEVVSPPPARQPAMSAASAPPEQPDTWGQAIKNVAQGAGKFTTGMFGSAVGNAAGLGALGYDITANALLHPFSGSTPGGYADPAAVRDRVSQWLTYQPENPGSVSSRIVDAPGQIIKGAGQGLSRATGTSDIPYLGSIFEGIPEAAANAGGIRALRAPVRTGAPLPAEPVPTTAELTAASKAAYATAKDSGVIVPAKGYETSLGKVTAMAKEEGINPTLHPKSTAVLKALDEARGKDLTLQEAETLRKIAMDAEDDLNPVTRAPTPDARIAGKIVDTLDESIDALSTNDEARALWARSRRSQMVDQMISRAEVKAGAHYTQAGMEHALRQEFKQLALNPRRMRGLTTEQKVAIAKVAKGGAMENTLRTLGKFDPTSGPVAALASLGTGAATGGLLPLAGFAGKRLATRATIKNVDAAREALVGRGLPKANEQPAPQTAQPVGSAANTASQPAIAPVSRTVPQIQQEIRRLSERARFELAGEEAGSPKMKAFAAEWKRLQNELAATREDQ